MKKIILWDWDGTLVDSLPYKYEGVWSEVFPDNQQAQKITREFIQTSKGKRYNRYGLIAHTLQEIGMLPQNTDPINNPLVEEYAQRYKAAVAQAASSFSLLPHAKDILSKLYNKGYDMYLISGGGSDEELGQLLDHFDVQKYFKGIFGYGPKKATHTGFGKYDNFLRVIAEKKVSHPSFFLVIGDSNKDREFAEKIGCDFIGIAHAYNHWPEKEKFLVTDLKDIVPFILDLKN